VTFNHRCFEQLFASLLKKPSILTSAKPHQLSFQQIQHLTFGTHDAITQTRLNKKEDIKMMITMSRPGAYLGAGAGFVLFGMFGLVPGSLLGGAAGINFAGMLFGFPLEPGILSRLIVLTAMLVGVCIICALFVTASSTIGWIIGAAIRTTVHENENTIMKSR
jgi:hypothetical protein